MNCGLYKQALVAAVLLLYGVVAYAHNQQIPGLVQAFENGEAKIILPPSQHQGKVNKIQYHVINQGYAGNDWDGVALNIYLAVTCAEMPPQAPMPPYNCEKNQAEADHPLMPEAAYRNLSPNSDHTFTLSNINHEIYTRYAFDIYIAQPGEQDEDEMFICRGVNMFLGGLLLTWHDEISGACEIYYPEQTISQDDTLHVDIVITNTHARVP